MKESTWRMLKPCDNCPFNTSGAGLHLRKTLRPERWREILAHLRHDGNFTCHKTADETGDGSNRQCAGALAWQDAHGLPPNQLRRICERLARL